MTSTRFGLGLALVVLAVVSGCGGGNPSAQPSASATADLEGGRKFAQCMRDNGVPDFPDPDPNGGFSAAQGLLDDAEAQKALDACRDLLPGARQAQNDPEQQEKLRKLAQCMRDLGHDMPDPDPNNPGAAVGANPNIDRNDPKVRKDIETCSKKVGFQPGGGS